MEKICKEQVIKLFNEGILTTVSAEWYNRQGYSIICKNGEVIDIVKEGD